MGRVSFIEWNLFFQVTHCRKLFTFEIRSSVLLKIERIRIRVHEYSSFEMTFLLTYVFRNVIRKVRKIEYMSALNGNVGRGLELQTEFVGFYY